MFVNVIKAEQKERDTLDMLLRIATMPENNLRNFDTMLNAKRKVRNTFNSNTPIGKIMGNLGGQSYFLSHRINNCLSAIDRTIDNNIMSLLGVTLNAAGFGLLLQMQDTLGVNYINIIRTLGNIQNFGPRALSRLQEAFVSGVENTIFDIVAMGTQAVNDQINALAQEAFCALLPSLNSLQNSLAPFLGGASNILEAVDSLTDEITHGIDGILRELQGEMNSLSREISQGLFGYSTNRMSTCASRPDSLLGLRNTLRQAIC